LVRPAGVQRGAVRVHDEHQSVSVRVIMEVLHHSREDVPDRRPPATAQRRTRDEFDLGP